MTTKLERREMDILDDSIAATVLASHASHAISGSNQLRAALQPITARMVELLDNAGYRLVVDTEDGEGE